MKDKKESTSGKLIGKIQKVEMQTIAPVKKTLAQIANKLNSKKKESGNKVELASKKESLVKVPTGVLELDYLLKGGFPKGRIVLLAGAESSWKSTICLRNIAEVQKLGGTAAYVDVERSFDPAWAKAHGVDLEQLLVLEPDIAEEAYNQMTEVILAGVDVVVLDSLNALSPKKEMFTDDKGMDAAGNEVEAMGISARKVSQWLRNNVGRIAKAKTSLLVITQLRDNINAGMYGNPVTITGGKAIKHYASIIIDTRQLLGETNKIKDDSGDVVGKNYAFKLSKNKTGRDSTEGQFAAYGSVLDNFTSMLKIGLKEGFIQRPNNKTYIINGVSFNGKGKALEALADESTGLYELCQKELRSVMGSTIYQYNPYEKSKDIEEANAVDVNEDEDGVLIPPDEENDDNQ